jgi:hypothetical protein
MRRYGCAFVASTACVLDKTIVLKPLKSFSDPASERELTLPTTGRVLPDRKQDLTTRHPVAAFLGLPLVTLKVIGAIHFEAARLWLKGAKLLPCPQLKPEMRAIHARLTEGIVPDTSR